MKILPSLQTTILKFLTGLYYLVSLFNTTDIAYGPYQSPGFLSIRKPSLAILCIEYGYALSSPLSMNLISIKQSVKLQLEKFNILPSNFTVPLDI